MDYWKEITEERRTQEHEEIWQNTVYPDYEVRMIRSSKIGRKVAYSIEMRANASGGRGSWHLLEEVKANKKKSRKVAKKHMRDMPFAGEAEEGNRHHDQKVFFDQSDLRYTENLEELSVDIDNGKAGGGWVATENDPYISNNFTIYDDGTLGFDQPISKSNIQAVEKELKNRGLM